MAPLRHENLVCMLGAVWNEGADKLCLVLEFAAKGSLDRFMVTDEFNARVGWSLMLDVALCLKYLHCDLPKPVLHRDIKPANVLVTAATRSKVADFGESRALDDDELGERDAMTMTMARVCSFFVALP